MTCDEADTHLLPMWSRQRETPTSPWSEWDPVDNGACAVDLLPRLTEAEFRTLPLPSPALTMQPDRGWVLVHTDDRADDAYNQTLSERRAQAVADWLVQRADVDPARVTVTGYGESAPVVPNDSDENRRLNRRVVISVER